MKRGRRKTRDKEEEKINDNTIEKREKEISIKKE